MPTYEFKVVPAPTRSLKLKGAPKGEDRFCVTLGHILNEEASGGWEFMRCETMPVRTGSWPFRRRESLRQFLVFRRGERLTLAAPTAPKAPAQVIPRRVRNAEAVARVSAGERRVGVPETSAGHIAAE